MAKSSYIRDWSPVPASRYREAQQAERGYWSEKHRLDLSRSAGYWFHAGYKKWSKRRALLDPFRVRKFRPENFQIPADEMEGSRVLDVGCGPVSKALSLVHCATVSAVDPLLNVYREMQPFGWDYFETAASVGAEELPFDDRSFDFVYCRNVLDHTRDADQVLREIVRVMPAQGQLLLDCDSRYGRGGGPAHPYAWTTETLQARVFEQFDPVTPISVRTTVGAWDGRGQRPAQVVRQWVCRLRLKPPTV